MNENIKKINFSALNNKDNKKEEVTNISPPINEEKINTSNHLSGLNEEKDNNRIVTVHLWKKKTPIKIKKEESSIKEETDISMWEKKEIISKENIKEENNIEKDNKNEVEKIEIKSDKNKDEVKVWDETLTIKPEKLFSNYKSDFNTKEDTIIEKLKKIKNLPKTRPQLVYSMIWILVIWITWLVLISPKDSILNNYKASVLWTETEQKIEKQVTNQNDINKEKPIDKINDQKEKLKKEKLENFLLKNNKKNNNIPEKNTDIEKNKVKVRKLKELLQSQKK